MKEDLCLFKVRFAEIFTLIKKKNVVISRKLVIEIFKQYTYFCRKFYGIRRHSFFVKVNAVFDQIANLSKTCPWFIIIGA